VGPPVPSNIIKLVDVEEKEYFAKNGQGEVWKKGFICILFTSSYKQK